MPSPADHPFTPRPRPRILLDGEPDIVLPTMPTPGIPFTQEVENLWIECPNENPVLLPGILRRTETATLIGASKQKKTWLLEYMALAMAAGKPFLGMDVPRTRVALLDLELTKNTLSVRLKLLADTLGITGEMLRGWLHVDSLRQRGLAFKDVHEYLRLLKADYYGLVIIDSFYNLFTEDETHDENSNARMGAAFSKLRRYGGEFNLSLILSHHSTKGDQSNKATIDKGSGGSAQARAVDSHIVLDAVKGDADAGVLEAKSRSFQDMQRLGLRWKYPLWGLDESVTVGDEAKGSGRGRGKKDGPAPTVWTAEAVVNKFVPTGAPLLLDAILAETAAVGLRPAAIKQWLAAAETAGTVTRTTDEASGRVAYFRGGGGVVKRAPMRPEKDKGGAKSNAPRKSALSAPMRPAPERCPECGKTFEPTRRDQLFCGKNCRNAATRKRSTVGVTRTGGAH